MGAILATPRAAKKLANLYRIVRIGVPQAHLPDFTGSPDGGPYQVVQVLLAAITADPVAAIQVFSHIMAASPGDSIQDVLRCITPHGPKACEVRRLAAQIAAIGQRNQAVTTAAGYQRWCPNLARYSFHTSSLGGAGPAAGIQAVDETAPRLGAAGTVTEPAIWVQGHPGDWLTDDSVEPDVHALPPKAAAWR